MKKNWRGNIFFLLNISASFYCLSFCFFNVLIFFSLSLPYISHSCNFKLLHIYYWKRIQLFTIALKVVFTWWALVLERLDHFENWFIPYFHILKFSVTIYMYIYYISVYVYMPQCYICIYLYRHIYVYICKETLFPARAISIVHLPCFRLASLTGTITCVLSSRLNIHSWQQWPDMNYHDIYIYTHIHVCIDIFLYT